MPSKAELLEQAMRSINEFIKQMDIRKSQCEKCHCKVYENFSEYQQFTEAGAILRKLNGWRNKYL